MDENCETHDEYDTVVITVKNEDGEIIIVCADCYAPLLSPTPPPPVFSRDTEQTEDRI